MYPVLIGVILAGSKIATALSKLPGKYRYSNKYSTGQVLIMVSINNVVGIGVALIIFFLVVGTIVMPMFATTYEYAITGMSAGTTQGLFVLVLALATVGFGVSFIKKEPGF